MTTEDVHPDLPSQAPQATGFRRSWSHANSVIVSLALCAGIALVSEDWRGDSRGGEDYGAYGTAMVLTVVFGGLLLIALVTALAEVIIVSSTLVNKPPVAWSFKRSAYNVFVGLIAIITLIIGFVSMGS